MSQDTDALDAYEQDDHSDVEERFGSVSGRHWAATYSCYIHDYITFKINH